jgi:hypothetical protein
VLQGVFSFFLLHKHSPAKSMPARGGWRALPVAIWSALPEVIRNAAAGAVIALNQHLLMRARGGQESRKNGQPRASSCACAPAFLSRTGRMAAAGWVLQRQDRLSASRPLPRHARGCEIRALRESVSPVGHGRPRALHLRAAPPQAAAARTEAPPVSLATVCQRPALRRDPLARRGAERAVQSSACERANAVLRPLTLRRRRIARPSCRHSSWRRCARA